MAKPYIALQPSEAVLVSSAAQIYAAYIVAGRAQGDTQTEWLQRSINEALRIAQAVDEKVQADRELD